LPFWYSFVALCSHFSLPCSVQHYVLCSYMRLLCMTVCYLDVCLSTSFCLSVCLFVCVGGGWGLCWIFKTSFTTNVSATQYISFLHIKMDKKADALYLKIHLYFFYIKHTTKQVCVCWLNEVMFFTMNLYTLLNMQYNACVSTCELFFMHHLNPTSLDVGKFDRWLVMARAGHFILGFCQKIEPGRAQA
jgi:hypothetical protein